MADTVEPCGQHTIWEPQCTTCRKLATRAELLYAAEEALHFIMLNHPPEGEAALLVSMLNAAVRKAKVP